MGFKEKLAFFIGTGDNGLVRHYSGRERQLRTGSKLPPPYQIDFSRINGIFLSYGLCIETSELEKLLHLSTRKGREQPILDMEDTAFKIIGIQSKVIGFRPYAQLVIVGLQSRFIYRFEIPVLVKHRKQLVINLYASPQEYEEIYNYIEEHYRYHNLKNTPEWYL